jgi:hypothetical protein
MDSIYSHARVTKRVGYASTEPVRPGRKFEPGDDNFHLTEECLSVIVRYADRAKLLSGTLLDYGVVRPNRLDEWGWVVRTVIFRERELRETMQRIVRLGAALLVAVLVVVIGAVPVSATNHEFVASVKGKTKGAQTDAQVFKTGAGTLECKDVSSTGEITEVKSTVHKETLTYSNCDAFGYSNVKFTPVHFEYSANGSARLESSVTITPEGAGCHITIPAQTVQGVAYENKGKGITATADAINIVSKGNGGTCGTEENSEGSYVGTIAAELEGGTVEWK